MTHNTKHKGWFYLCPVFIYELESECMEIAPRHWSLLVWLLFNLVIAELINFVLTIFGYEPGIMLSVGTEVEELTKPE